MPRDLINIERGVRITLDHVEISVISEYLTKKNNSRYVVVDSRGNYLVEEWMYKRLKKVAGLY